MSYVSRRGWRNNSSGFGYSQRRGGLFRRILLFVLFLFIIYELITSLFIITYRVESISMEPTVPSGAVVMASPLIYGPELPFASVRIPGIRKPARGDLVVSTPAFHDKQSWYTKLIDTFVNFFTLQRKGFGQNSQNWAGSSMVKRVVGVPGDTVMMKNYTIFIKPEGNTNFFSEKEIIQVEYSIENFSSPELLGKDFPLSGNMRKITLGYDEYFLAGDNRTMSNDSYYWGPVSIENISAKVILEYAPELKMLQ